MLSCQEVTELVTDYLEERLSFTQRARFQLHVAMCKNCRRYHRQMRLTIRTLGKLPEQAIPADVREELMERFSYRKAEGRSEEHTSELQSHLNLVCRLLLEKKKKTHLT